MKSRHKKYSCLILVLISVASIFGFTKERNGDSFESIEIADISVKNDSVWIRKINSDSLSVDEEIKVYRNSELLEKFSFSESFSWDKENLTQTVGIGSLKSSGINIYRYWDKSKNLDPGKINISGWILISDSRCLTSEDIKKIKFNYSKDSAYFTKVENKLILVKKSIEINLDK